MFTELFGELLATINFGCKIVLLVKYQHIIKFDLNSSLSCFFSLWNLYAAKKVNLADVGIVGGLTETDETSQAPPTSYYVGRAMGAGSGLGRSSFTSTATDVDDMFSNHNGQQFQFGGFQK